MTVTSRPSLVELVPPAVRAALLEGCEAVAFEDGVAVVRVGEPGDSYYIVAEGSAEVLSPTGEPLGRLGPGEGFGELALLLNRPRTATVIARGPLSCLRLSTEHFRALVRDPDRLLSVVSTLAARQADDMARLERAFARIKHAYSDTVRALAAAVEARDPYTGGHVERSGQLCRLLAAELGMSPEEQDMAELSGALHDVGKVAVPDAVLRKPAPLDEAEQELMRVHPVAGAAIVAQVQHLARIAPAVRGHHERWDGSGYPDGLSGEEIPFGARLVMVADTFDAITTSRPYRSAQHWQAAVDEIAAGSGTQFSPGVVDAFLSLARRGALSSHGPH
jgi:CRP-like cAMP-binding protein